MRKVNLMGALKSTGRLIAGQLIGQGVSYKEAAKATGLGLKYLYRIFPKKAKHGRRAGRILR